MAGFQTSGETFRKLQGAIWLTVIKEILKFPPRLGPFCQINYLFNSIGFTRVTKFKKDTFGLVSKVLERDFINSFNSLHIVGTLF